MRCPVCGTVAVPNARYCHACGAALPAATAGVPTERRVVTVLFGDLSDFTAWSEGLEPERVSAVTDKVMAVCAQAVTAFGGHVDKLVGDGIMAVFGAPTSHEDDPERAVRAALAMHRGVGRLVGDEVGGGRRLGLRVGLNTGEVAAGMQASMSYTVIGDAVNTAARLSDAAGVGGTYAGVATQRATRDRVAWRHLPPLRLKGKRDPVEAYELLNLREAPGTRPGLGDEAPFVGREAEMGRLYGRAREAFDRRTPQVTVLMGDPGLGKSRLGGEFGRQAADSLGARTLRVRCAAYGDGRLGPLLRLVRQACGIPADADPDETADRLYRTIARLSEPGNEDGEEDGGSTATTGRPEIRPGPLLDLLGAGQDPLAAHWSPELEEARLPGTTVRDPTPAAVAALLRGLAAELPLVIIVDDAHNAGPATSAALADVVDELDGPVFMLVSGRPELVRGGGLANRLPDADVLTLQPLSGAASARLLRSYLGGGALPPADEERLLAIVQGNPFYLAEVVALLVEQGALTGGSRGWRLAEGSLSGGLLSSDLAAVLTARIDSLPAGSRAVLRDAAVIGERIPVSALAALRAGDFGGMQWRADGLTKDLAELVARRMLRHSNRGGYTFVTAFMRQAAYDVVGKADLAARHARLARWAEALSEDDPELAGIERDSFIARQVESALRQADAMRLGPGTDPRAVAVLGISALGRLAAATLADSQPALAGQLLDRAADLTKNGELPVELQLQRAQVKARTGGYEPARELALRLLDREATIPKPSELPASRGPDTTAAAASNPCSADNCIEVGALLVLGEAERGLGHVEAAAEAWERAANAGRENGLPLHTAEALRQLGMLEHLGGRLEAADKHFVEAYEIAVEQEDLTGQGWALQHIAWSATSRADFDRAETALRRAGGIFAQLDDFAGRSWVTGTEAFVRLLQGRLRQARALAEEFLPYGERAGEQWGVAALHTVDAFAAAELGELSDADKYASDALRAFERLDDPWGRSLALVVRGIVARDTAEDPRSLPGTAVPLLTDAVRSAERAEHPLTVGIARTMLGYCRLHIGDPVGAEKEARTTLDLLGSMRVDDASGVGAQVLLALARRDQDDHEGALRILAEVVKADWSASLIFPRQQAYAQYAGLLLDVGRAEEGLEWARRAYEIQSEDVRSQIVAMRTLARALHETGAIPMAREMISEARQFAYGTEQRVERLRTDAMHARIMASETQPT
jgi:class 3 adenylate cyclase/tetratricopeptide (TPR) repeat protein